MKTVAKSAVVTLLAFGAACAFADVTIRPEKAVIVAPSVKTGSDLAQAIDELRLHVRLITGTDLTVVKKAPAGAYAFTFDETVLGGNAEACAWTVSPDGTAFRGHAAFAVTDFLENALDVRWPEEDDISYVPRNPLTVSKLSGAWTPRFVVRNVRQTGAGRVSPNMTFRLRMRCGQHDAPRCGHAFTGFWARFGRERRDIFAMRPDGIRGPSDAKPEELMGNIAVYAANTKASLAMCCTSTGLVDIIVKDWIAAGKPQYINLCENDVPGQNSCQCPACKALDVTPAKVNPEWQTHFSDRYIYFANQVLAAARPHRADVKACFYAYNATQDAPARERLDDAIVLGLVPTDFTDGYIRDFIASWKKMGLKEFFYRPNRHHYISCPYLPLGADEHFYTVLKQFADAGAIGFDYDAGAASRGGFNWLDRYVLLHGMQDPSKSYDYWEDHYCQAYGAAKDDVKAYLAYWRENVWNKRIEPDMHVLMEKGRWFNIGRGLLQNLGDYYRTEDYEKAEAFLRAAEAKELAAPQRAVLAKLRRAHDHGKVFFEAVAHKSKANTEALIAFRKLYGYPLYTWAEQYFGDVTGVEGLLGPEKKSGK